LRNYGGTDLRESLYCRPIGTLEQHPTITPHHPPPGRRPETISVVIPVRNGEHDLANQLEALTRQTYDGSWDVVISDNGSTDSTLAVAESFADRLRIITVAANDGIGASYAHNVGRTVATGEFIACCDADDIVGERWLEKMAEAAEDFHMVGGRLDEESLNDGVAWRPKVAQTQLHSTDWLPYAIGANLGIWVETLDSVGGWGEEFLNANDTELSYRVQVRGWRLGYAHDAVVKYRHRRSSAELFKQFRNYGRTDPVIHAEFQHAGHPRSSLWRAAKRWGRIVLTTPMAAISRPARSRWIYTLAYSLGRLEGSIKSRVLFL